MHRDRVRHHWLEGYDELVERMEPDDPRAVPGPAQHAQEVAGSASYFYISPPHAETDCPFRDTTRLAHRSVDAVDR